MSPRNRVLVKSVSLDIYEIFERKTIEEIQQYTSSLKLEYENDIQQKDLYVNFSVNFCGYDGGYELNLNVYRWENDTEYESRIAAEEKSRKAKEARKLKASQSKKSKSDDDERKEYLRLKEKYENSVDTVSNL